MSKFYNTEIPIETKISLLISAIDICDNYHVDVLDCSKSWSRQSTDLKFEDILPKLNEDCHFVVIEREDFLSKKLSGEIGFSEMGKGPNHFLFIYLTLENLEKIITQYNLKLI